MFKDGQTIIRHETSLTQKERQWCVDNNMSYDIKEKEEKWEDCGHSGVNTAYYITFYKRNSDYKNKCRVSTNNINIIYTIIEKMVIAIIIFMIIYFNNL